MKRIVVVAITALVSTSAFAQTRDVDGTLERYAVQMRSKGRQDLGDVILANVSYHRASGRILRSLLFDYIVKDLPRGAPNAKSRQIDFQYKVQTDYCYSKTRVMEFARTAKVSVYYMLHYSDGKFFNLASAHPKDCLKPQELNFDDLLPQSPRR